MAAPTKPTMNLTKQAKDSVCQITPEWKTSEKFLVQEIYIVENHIITGCRFMFKLYIYVYSKGIMLTCSIKSTKRKQRWKPMDI